MASFKLKNTQPAAASALNAPEGPARAFQPDVLLAVRSVKRMSPYAWPFCVKNSSVPDSSGPSGSSLAISISGI